MGIIPHNNVEKAIELALNLDVPFWPQLPNVSYYEDMYVQASQYFPGITVDAENKRIHFNSAKFEEQLIDYSEKMVNPETFSLSENYSVVYHRFLAEDLHDYVAIRGQLIGPVSCGFKVTDENNMPIIYNEESRALLFDFLQRKVNAQYCELREKNQNAFVWLDEPGLGWVFSGLSGFSDVQAKQAYMDFLSDLESPKALHLCANVNLPYLLSLGIELLSFDAYQLELMPKGYTQAVADFICSGGIICWGIVPTDSSSLDNETPESLAKKLTSYWQVVAQNTKVAVKQIAEQALIAPSRCCLKNIGQVGTTDEKPLSDNKSVCDLTPEERVVELAFNYLDNVSKIIRDDFSI